MRCDAVRFVNVARLAGLVYTLLASFSVSAYIGPGAGLTAIGSFLALCAAILVAIIGFLWFPIKRVLRKRSAKSDTDSRADDT